MRHDEAPVSRGISFSALCFAATVGTIAGWVGGMTGDVMLSICGLVGVLAAFRLLSQD
jgi:hypothetical protein